jgi:hypothetical protein
MYALQKQGKMGKKIPEKYRVYNVQTGEIFDIRNMHSK